MTVGIGVNCSDGIVLACDSLTTFGRGVPVLRYTNKVHLLQHDGLKHPVAVVAAGITTYFNKFQDRACRKAIGIASKAIGRELDIVDFCEEVCEPVISSLYKEYVIDRYRFFGAPVVDYGLSLIVAGATEAGELRSYHVHAEGLTERIEEYGTTGSGAAYAELFLRYLLTSEERCAESAGRAAAYAIKGVELMDPNVAGDTNIMVISFKDSQPAYEDFPKESRPEKARETMEQLLRRIGSEIEQLVVRD